MIGVVGGLESIMSAMCFLSPFVFFPSLSCMIGYVGMKRCLCVEVGEARTKSHPLLFKVMSLSAGIVELHLIRGGGFVRAATVVVVVVVVDHDGVVAETACGGDVGMRHLLSIRVCLCVWREGRVGIRIDGVWKGRRGDVGVPCPAGSVSVVVCWRKKCGGEINLRNERKGTAVMRS